MVSGFPTREIDRGGRRFTLGPTSATIGDGVVYVGNRADASVCVLDAQTLRRGACLALGPRAEGWTGGPDGVVYVAATREVWITRGGPPKGLASPDLSLDVLDASDPRALRRKATVPLDGIAEGYAVDDARALFYTNLEDRGETVAIDARTHTVASRWKTCDDPRGLAIDLGRQLLFVACPGRVISLDLGHGAREAGSVATGAGLDFIDYSERDHRLYAASGRTATLTIARVEADGALTAIATMPTTAGARSVVAGAPGTAYVADPQGGRILVVR
jgi:hypothetical protein